jgi:hypothetical protein
LENQIELNHQYLSYNKIEPIGKHYANQWGEEDLSQQIREGSRFVDFESGRMGNLKRKAEHLNDKSRIILRE